MKHGGEKNKSPREIRQKRERRRSDMGEIINTTLLLTLYVKYERNLAYARIFIKCWCELIRGLYIGAYLNHIGIKSKRNRPKGNIEINQHRCYS